jgi:hypothetical protein
MKEYQPLPWADDEEAHLADCKILGKVLLHERIPLPEGHTDFWATGLEVEDRGGQRWVTWYSTAENKLMLVPIYRLQLTEAIPDVPAHT